MPLRLSTNFPPKIILYIYNRLLESCDLWNPDKVSILLESLSKGILRKCCRLMNIYKYCCKFGNILRLFAFHLWMWYTMWSKLWYEWLGKLIRWCDCCDISLSPVYYTAYILLFQDSSCFGKICTFHPLIWRIFFTVTFQSHVRD